LIACRATWNVHSAVLILGIGATACIDSGAPEIGELTSASTVGSHASSGCSTAVVIGLSRQIAEEANCEHPGNFVHFPSGNGISITSNAVLPYLAQGARDDLETVAKNHSLQINSALRTVAQQYLLYHWYLEGRCGITAAATPGTSNHEGGRAVDLQNWASRIGDMAAHGWHHDVPGDVVHFDHTSTPDRRGEDVKAFQELWNRNHATDRIATDGEYGPETEARLKESPSTGFAHGASCGAQAVETVVAIDGADVLPPLTQQQFTITLANFGTTDWPAGATVELVGAATSPLYDPSWPAQNIVTTLADAIPAGDTGDIAFDITTPQASAETPIVQSLQLADGASVLASFDLAVTVEPGMTTPTSSDGNDESDDGGDVSGGCNAGGGGGAGLGLALALGLALVAALRRQRRMRTSDGSSHVAGAYLPTSRLIIRSENHATGPNIIPIIACIARPHANATGRVHFSANHSGAHASNSTVTHCSAVHANPGMWFARNQLTGV
jgi:hypothetical protein